MLFRCRMPKTILFVEDSEIELIAYGNALRRAGYDVFGAKDGLEAMRYLHTHVPDMILLDLLLPKFDGVEVLKFIRKDSRIRGVPIIIFSTNSIICSEDEPLLEKAARRLLKYKCTPRLLLQEIRDVLGDKPEESTPPQSPATPATVQ